MGHVATIRPRCDIRGAILRELGHDFRWHAGYAAPNGAARTYWERTMIKLWGEDDAQEGNDNAHF